MHGPIKQSERIENVKSIIHKVLIIDKMWCVVIWQLLLVFRWKHRKNNISRCFSFLCKSVSFTSDRKRPNHKYALVSYEEDCWPHSGICGEIILLALWAKMATTTTSSVGESALYSTRWVATRGVIDKILYKIAFIR